MFEPPLQEPPHYLFAPLADAAALALRGGAGTRTPMSPTACATVAPGQRRGWHPHPHEPFFVCGERPQESLRSSRRQQKSGNPYGSTRIPSNTSEFTRFLKTQNLKAVPRNFRGALTHTSAARTACTFRRDFRQTATRDFREAPRVNDPQTRKNSLTRAHSARLTRTSACFGFRKAPKRQERKRIA